uniref:transposase n=2 Tax=Candidatus Enterovibrio escicola TaxID=1927127 RepID=UPI001238364B|nr:transposase [Candidatus Enterovibrio escacola]
MALSYVKVMTDNVDDRKPLAERVNELWGCLCGDKGYISDPLQRELANKGVTLITGVKKDETQSDETLDLPNAPEMIYY